MKNQEIRFNDSCQRYSIIIGNNIFGVLQKKIRLILKSFQKKFARKYKKVCIEGRDIGTVILPKADIKFFFKCDLETAAKRRFKEY